MKIVKCSLVVLAIAIVCNIATAFAANTVPATGKVGISATIPVGGEFDSDYWTKTADLIQQSYEFQSAMTTITDPCNSCKFTAKLKMPGTGTEQVTGVTGNRKYYMSADAYLTGDFKVIITRAQLTAVTSYHTGDWWVNR